MSVYNSLSRLRPLVSYVERGWTVLACSYGASLGIFMFGLCYLGHQSGWDHKEWDRIMLTDSREKRVFNAIQAVGWAVGLPFHSAIGFVCYGRRGAGLYLAAGPIHIF